MIFFQVDFHHLDRPHSSSSNNRNTKCSHSDWPLRPGRRRNRASKRELLQTPLLPNRRVSVGLLPDISKHSTLQ
jgi:hypothetical protein